MSGPTALEQQLAEERRTKQRQYVRSNTRARWSFVGIAVALLAAARVAGLVPISWSFFVGFAAAFGAANYGMQRLARDAAFKVWYAHLNVALGTALITAVAYAVGGTGHLLYAAYLIAPLQAAYYRGREEAWQALVLNLAGFALLTALRQGSGAWGWTLYVEESLVLVLCCAALVPMLTKIVRRLRATREVLAQIERGDLTVALQDPESDELGYLGVSVNRTTEAIAATVRQVQRQAHDLAPMAQQLAASAQELQAAAQQISAAAQQLSSGTERQRQLIGQGREDSEGPGRRGSGSASWRTRCASCRSRAPARPTRCAPGSRSPKRRSARCWRRWSRAAAPPRASARCRRPRERRSRRSSRTSTPRCSSQARSPARRKRRHGASGTSCSAWSRPRESPTPPPKEPGRRRRRPHSRSPRSTSSPRPRGTCRPRPPSSPRRFSGSS